MIKPPPDPYAGNQNALTAQSVGSIISRQPRGSRDHRAGALLIDALRATTTDAALGAIADPGDHAAARWLLDHATSATPKPYTPYAPEGGHR